VSNILYWLFQWVKGELSIPGRLIALFFFICLFMVPLFTVNPYVLRIFILAAIFSIFAASWDLLSGFVGQINLGHALFFGVAAFSSALLNIHLAWPPLATIPVGALASVLAGLIVGLPALRLRGFYLSLVTLAFPIILTGIIFIFPDFTGGELGLYGLDRLSDSRILDYFIVILVMICCLLLMWKFTDAKSKIIRTGVIFHAIREDEITARASGINTTRYKLLAYVMSGFFAGIAGGLYAHFMRIAGPSTLDLMITFQGILWTIFGGIVTIYGPVVGVFILYPLLEFANLHPSTANIRFILFALVLIFTTLFMPEGLSTWVLDKIEIKCPRCKVVNFATRRNCRACNAPLHLERGK
jgi:branched-chain amino acid transport system permease protein